MFRRLVIMRLLNCVTETIQVTEGCIYFPWGPHFAQSYAREWAWGGGLRWCNSISWTKQNRAEPSEHAVLCLEVLVFSELFVTCIWNICTFLLWWWCQRWVTVLTVVCHTDRKNHTSLNENYVVPCVCLRAIWNMHDSCYSSVARHIEPCICHTALRHIHGNT